MVSNKKLISALFFPFGNYSVRCLPSKIKSKLWVGSVHDFNAFAFDTKNECTVVKGCDKE